MSRGGVLLIGFWIGCSPITEKSVKESAVSLESSPRQEPSSQPQPLPSESGAPVRITEQPVPFEKDFKGNAPESKPLSVEEPAKESPRNLTFDDVLRLQREIVARNPYSEEERKRLAVLYLLSRNYPDAKVAFEGVKSKEGDRFAALLDAYLDDVLGDHRLAMEKLTAVHDAWRMMEGFRIEKLILCPYDSQRPSVRGYENYDAASSEKVRPISRTSRFSFVVYVQVRNFALQRSGERHILHLKYGWELFNDRQEKVPVALWEAAPPGAKEDRLELSGPIREYYQFFRLPIPERLPYGPYQVRIMVEDVVGKKSDRRHVSIYVAE